MNGNVTKNDEFISNSQNRTKIMFLTPKRSHSASSTNNMKKGIRRNYIPNIKALAQVLIEKKEMKNPTCPKTLTTQNHVFYPKKEGQTQHLQLSR